MILRDITRADFEEVHQIRMSVHENILSNPQLVTIEAYIRETEQTGKGWVVELDDEIVGFGIANLANRSIWALFVDPNHEGKGVGRLLQDQMLDWLRSNGADSVELSTEPGTRAERFYRASGWKAIGQTEHGEVRFEMSLS